MLQLEEYLVDQASVGEEYLVDQASVGEEYWRRVIGRAQWPEQMWNKWSFRLRFLLTSLLHFNETQK